MNFIIDAPGLTIPTYITRSYAIRLASELRMAGHNVKIFGDPSMRVRTIHALRSMENPVYVYFGHGEPEFMYGTMHLSNLTRRRLLKVGDQEFMEALVGKTIYTLSCFVRAGLGPWLVSNGARAFFGSDERMLVFFSDVNKDGREDLYRIFRTIPMALSEGKSEQEAYQMFLEKIDEFMDHAVDANDTLFQEYMSNLKTHYKLVM